MIVEWPKKKLGELAEICRGSSPRPITDTRFFDGGTVPWVKIADATKSGKFLYETKQHINDFGASFSRRLPPGTILVAASGTLGYTQILGVEGCAHDGWLILQNLRGLDRDFAYYALKTLEQHFFNSGSGAAIQNINTDILRESEVPCPPLRVQQRIAGILSAYDELIENSQRRIKILETMARALYREWFVHFRFPGHENHPRIASALGQIPKGWELQKLGQLCSKLMDGTHDSPPPVEAGFPLITGRHIKGGFIDFSDAYQISPEEHQKVMNRSRPENGDIIYSNIGTLGATAIVDQEFEFSIKNVALLKPITRAHSSFLYCHLEAPEKLSEMTTKASGTSQKFFSLQFLRHLELVVPPEKLIEQFSEKLTPVLRSRSLLMKGIQNLRRTRDLLLPRLLSGQVSLEALEP